MRSPISLGILFLAVAGLALAGVTGGTLSVAAYGIAGLIVLAGLLVMTGMKAGYYLGIVAGGVMALTGVVAWAGMPRYALPYPPALSVVVGLYMCMRIAMAHRMFGPKQRIRREPSEVAEAADPEPRD